MKTTSKEGADRREAERRGPTADRRSETVRAVAGDRRVVDSRGLGAAMVDALEDILQWERASERALKVAGKVGEPN